MTFEQVVAIRVAARELHTELPARHKTEQNSARIHLDTLQSRCDHKNPDGTSAIDETGMFMRCCTICHWNDF